MFSITKKGLTDILDEEIGSLQNEFNKNHCICIANFIEEGLLNGIMNDIENAVFTKSQHYDINNNAFASDLSIVGKNIALHKLAFLLNNESLFRVIEKITSCSDIKNFSGRIYKNMPNQNHHLDWHDDTNDESRLIAISINLSLNKYEGGKFQIREKSSKKIYREVVGGRPGDAHIFKVSPLLEHRVTETIGSFPRIAAAGWFTSNNSSRYFIK